MLLNLPISTADIIAELEREKSMRQRVFPRFVKDGLLEQDEADRRMAVLDEAIRRLRPDNSSGSGNA